MSLIVKASCSLMICHLHVQDGGPVIECLDSPATRHLRRDANQLDFFGTWDWPDANQLKSTLVNWSLGIKSSLIDINSSFIESTGPFLRTTCCRESRKMEKSPPDGQTTWTSHNRWRGMMVLQNSAFSMVNGHEQACLRVIWWVGRLLSSPCQNSLIHKRIVVDCVSQWSKP